jgi:hypothetical protein
MGKTVPITYIGPYAEVVIVETDQTCARGETVHVVSELAGRPPKLDADGNVEREPIEVEYAPDDEHPGGETVIVGYGDPTDPGSGLLAQHTSWAPVTAKKADAPPPPSEQPTIPKDGE